MKPTNPNAHTYVEDNDVKVSIMTGGENVNAQTYRRTVEQRHCSDSVFSLLQQQWRRNSVARYCLQLSQFKTCRKERFCSFPHRHGEATGKPETRDETRGTPKRAFRTRLPPILTLSTRYQTGWNVTKCHACHAKRQDSLLGNIRKGHVFQLPP